MKKPGTLLTLLLVFILAGDLKGQTYPLSDFVETALPKPNSIERAKIHEGGLDFAISIRNGKLKIRDYKQKQYDEDVKLFVNNGKFIGIDNGEWGGELKFVSLNDDTTIIKKGNILFLFKYNREIYFIESLAHMGINEGALYKVISTNNAYAYQKILDFDDAPRVMCIVNGDILVASYNNFYKLHDLKKEKIFPDLLAEDLIPWSLVAIDARHVYMGLTAGYVEIDLIGKSYKFYQYKKHTAHE